MARKRGDRPEVALTEGAIRVSWKGKVRTILPSPKPPDSEDEADFFVDLDDIVCWDAPDDEIEIEMHELQRILEAIDEAFDRMGLVVAYD
jgi:hypothetical protein